LKFIKATDIVLNRNVDFGDSTLSQITMSHDAFALNATHIYNYNEERGLVKVLMNKNGMWDRVVANNKTLTGLKEVSIVCAIGHLLLRHKGLSDMPFLAFDCETLEQAPELA
jgi:hypothetical protein